MNSSKSELDFNGWCRGIHGQWSRPDDRNSRQIVGDFIDRKPIKLQHGTELASKMIRTVYAKA
jgi:hypothetical protein